MECFRTSVPVSSRHPSQVTFRLVSCNKNLGHQWIWAHALVNRQSLRHGWYRKTVLTVTVTHEPILWMHSKLLWSMIATHAVHESSYCVVEWSRDLWDTWPKVWTPGASSIVRTLTLSKQGANPPPAPPNHKKKTHHQPTVSGRGGECSRVHRTDTVGQPSSSSFWSLHELWGTVAPGLSGPCASPRYLNLTAVRVRFIRTHKRGHTVSGSIQLYI